MTFDDLRNRMVELNKWRKAMAQELAALPETLARLREGVDNFQRVSRRMSDATDTLEQVTQIQSGAMKAVRDQLASAPGGSAMTAAFEEAMERAAKLNPFFWPRRPSSS
jgi:rhamnogalacturonyl hydrolase YesR